MLAAVSLAAAQSDRMTERIAPVMSDHPSIEEPAQSALHVSGCHASTHRPMIEHAAFSPSPQHAPEFSPSDARFDPEVTVEEVRSPFSPRSEPLTADQSTEADDTSLATERLFPSELASRGDRPSTEPLVAETQETDTLIRRTVRPPVFDIPSLPAPDLTPPSLLAEVNAIQPTAAGLEQISVPRTKTLRPSSGRQFYRQRQTALQTGQSYTRITPDQFSESWLPATYEPSHEDWVSLLAHEARAMARGQGPNRLTIMVGDSISLWFPTEYMSRHQFWLNQSISGDTATGTLGRLDLFAGTNPDVIHLMIGINDLRRGTSDLQLLETQRRIIRRLRQQHPHAQVIVHSLLPTRMMSLPSDRIRRINQQLGAIAIQEGAHLLDLHRYFVDSNGQLNSALTTDGLHLNASGYALWYQVLNQMRLI
ncbi:MAG: GDSL-type esterase/lipase family protein [Leptolyngbyaceae bacterium]|nr:GDSL-type esterase/lipase family protein [Leptolyngbyaceae bacterium]